MKRTKTNKIENVGESQFEKMYEEVFHHVPPTYLTRGIDEKNSSLEQPTDLIDVQTSTIYGLVESPNKLGN